MTTPSKIDVDTATRETLAGLALSDPDLLLAGLEARAEWQETSGLDGRTYSLVKIAALIALDAPRPLTSGRWPTRWGPAAPPRISSVC